MTKPRLKQVPKNPKVEGFYERHFTAQVDLEKVVRILICNGTPFNFYHKYVNDSDVGDDEAGFYLSVGSTNKYHLKYAGFDEDEMFDEICNSHEKSLQDGYSSDLGYFIREKLRELYELRNDNSLMEDFIELKEEIE